MDGGHDELYRLCDEWSEVKSQVEIVLELDQKYAANEPRYTGRAHAHAFNTSLVTIVHAEHGEDSIFRHGKLEWKTKADLGMPLPVVTADMRRHVVLLQEVWFLVLRVWIEHVVADRPKDLVVDANEFTPLQNEFFRGRGIAVWRWFLSCESVPHTELVSILPVIFARLNHKPGCRPYQLLFGDHSAFSSMITQKGEERFLAITSKLECIQDDLRRHDSLLADLMVLALRANTNLILQQLLSLSREHLFQVLQLMASHPSGMDTVREFWAYIMRPEQRGLFLPLLVLVLIREQFQTHGPAWFTQSQAPAYELPPQLFLTVDKDPATFTILTDCMYKLRGLHLFLANGVKVDPERGAAVLLDHYFNYTGQTHGTFCRLPLDVYSTALYRSPWMRVTDLTRIQSAGTIWPALFDGTDESNLYLEVMARYKYDPELVPESYRAQYAARAALKPREVYDQTLLRMQTAVENAKPVGPLHMHLLTSHPSFPVPLAEPAPPTAEFALTTTCAATAPATVQCVTVATPVTGVPPTTDILGVPVKRKDDEDSDGPEDPDADDWGVEDTLDVGVFANANRHAAKKGHASKATSSSSHKKKGPAKFHGRVLYTQPVFEHERDKGFAGKLKKPHGQGFYTAPHDIKDPVKRRQAIAQLLAIDYSITRQKIAAADKRKAKKK